MNTENNRIIAEFMDLKPVEVFGNYSISKDHVSVNCENSNDAMNSFCKSTKYHSDWNWLMEVVEKIYNTVEEEREDDLDWDFLTLQIRNSFYFPTKETVYNSCVEFIKWYNLQNS